MDECKPLEGGGVGGCEAGGILDLERMVQEKSEMSDMSALPALPAEGVPALAALAAGAHTCPLLSST